MKISFSTLSCPNWSWNKILQEAVRLGYDGIELRGVDGEMFLPKAAPFIAENIKTTMEKIKSKGLEITDLGSSVQFHDPEKYEEYLTEGKTYIDLAQALGVPYVRIFADHIPVKSEKEKTIELISKGIKELCSYCEGKNVICLLETHGDFADINNIIPVLEKVNSAYVGILWDIEHTFKVYGEDVSEFLDKTWKFIKHTHIKDVKKVGNEFILTMIGEGDIPIGKLIGILKERGFDGYLSLEWEKKWFPSLEEPEVVLPAYIEYIKKYL